MQFRVPQFIDMEDKIIGPLTLKQFGYIVGACGVSFIIWTFVPIRILAVLIIIPVAGLFLALAFIRYNNRSFGELLESAFDYYTNPKVYTWKKPAPVMTTNEKKIDDLVVDTTKEMIISKTNKDRLRDLSLGLDVLDTNPHRDRK